MLFTKKFIVSAIVLIGLSITVAAVSNGSSAITGDDILSDEISSSIEQIQQATDSSLSQIQQATDSAVQQISQTSEKNNSSAQIDSTSSNTASGTSDNDVSSEQTDTIFNFSPQQALLSAKNVNVKILGHDVFNKTKKVIFYFIKKQDLSQSNSEVFVLSDKGFSIKNANGDSIPFEYSDPKNGSPCQLIINYTNKNDLSQIFITCNFINYNAEWKTEYDKLQSGAISESDYNNFVDAQPQTIQFTLVN